MADAITNPAGTVGQPVQGTSNTPQGTQPAPQQAQDPAWLSALPEEHRETARKEYLLQSDYTKKTTELSERQKEWEKKEADYRKQADQWDTFQKSYEPFRAQLQQHWDKIQPILSGQVSQQQRVEPQGPQPGQQQFENWDVLPPQEQAKRLADYVNQQYLTGALSQWEQRWNQQMAQREQQYQNYLNILTEAYGRKFQDPSLDLNAYMKKVLDIQMGRENPMELGYTAITSDATKKALEEAAYKRGQEDKELEFKNKQQTTGAMQSNVIPYFRQKPFTRDQVNEAVRNQAVSKGIPW